MSSVDLLPIPEAGELSRPELARALELDVRHRVRDIDDLEMLAPAVEQINELVKALAGTKPAIYAMAAARRIEWQIGRLLGPPRDGRGRPPKGENRSGSVFSEDDELQFRHVGTLDLEWDALEPWARSRAQLVKTARERRRKPSDAYDLRPGDFREVLIDIEPAALILTDPPYAETRGPDYDALGAFAADRLVAGGSLICYVGQRTLPIALPALGRHLRYVWTLALVQRGGIQQLRMGVRCGWKPVLWFTNGARRGHENVYDVLTGTAPSKELHEWAQGVDETLPLIESLTDPQELVCDPFAGSGSFGVAACKLGRRFVGATL